MRLLVRLLVFFILVNAGFGRWCFPESCEKVQVGRLVIESRSLPDADRRWIIHLFQQKTYARCELSIRIETALRTLGYFRAIADEPKVSVFTTKQGRRIARVTVKVEEGTQYRLGQIRFENATLFPTARLRGLFRLQEGDLFNVSKIGEGLEDMRKLYNSEGYVNFVAIPEEHEDESNRVTDLVLNVSEGKSYDFGGLVLDGLEPHAGAGQALLDSWRTLQGKRYNPLVLQQWLLTNRSNWQVGAHRIVDPLCTAQNVESRVVNVRLSFPGLSPSGQIDKEVYPCVAAE